MPVLILAASYYLIGGYWFWLTLVGVGWHCRRRHRRHVLAAAYAEYWHEDAGEMSFADPQGPGRPSDTVDRLRIITRAGRGTAVA